MPMVVSENALAHPLGKMTSGPQLASLEQRDFYRIIRDRRRLPARIGAERNITEIQNETKNEVGTRPTKEKVWLATKHTDFTHKTRDFIWKSVQNSYKIGNYWTHIDGYQERGICPLCDEVEDMDHILNRCKASTRIKSCEMANEVWAKRHQSPLPNTLGGILGCGLTNFGKEGKPDKGKSRLYHILVSETAYLIWKLRNERRIRDNDGGEQPEDEVHNRWTHAINKRLTTDRFLTNETRFQGRALESRLVKGTWKNCLKEEENLPADWPTRRGVLVGIAVARPPGRAG